MYKRFFISFLLSASMLFSAFGSPDSLVFQNGNVVIGEIQGMRKGVLEIDAPYGDSNFLIKWTEVGEIYTTSNFIVTVKKEIYRGKISTVEGKSVKIYNNDTVFIETDLNNIVFIRSLEDNFSDRFSASIELGFNATRAQNLRQFSNRNALGYRANKWVADANYSSLRSSQDDIDDIVRQDGQFNFSLLLKNSWYVIASYSILSNSEQKLDLRTNTQLGMGKFLYSSNKSFWSLKIGANNNNENFSNEQSSQNSWEGFLSTQLSLYDVGDFELMAEYIGFSGLNDFSRFRFDTSIDLKYDLPFDLFIRTGIMLNFDNQPAIEGSETAYIIRTGLGWEW